MLCKVFDVSGVDRVLRLEGPQTAEGQIYYCINTDDHFNSWDLPDAINQLEKALANDIDGDDHYVDFDPATGIISIDGRPYQCCEIRINRHREKMSSEIRRKCRRRSGN